MIIKRRILLNFNVRPFIDLYESYLQDRISASECKSKFFRLIDSEIHAIEDAIKEARSLNTPLDLPTFDVYGNVQDKVTILPTSKHSYDEFGWASMEMIDTDFFHPAEDYTDIESPVDDFAIDEPEFRRQVELALKKMAALQEKYKDYYK